jgi:hypothetical protein
MLFINNVLNRPKHVEYTAATNILTVCIAYAYCVL